MKNDLINGETLQKITERFENFVISQTGKILSLADGNENKVKRSGVEVLTFLGPLFETERFKEAYSVIIKNLANVFDCF